MEKGQPDNADADVGSMYTRSQMQEIDEYYERVKDRCLRLELERLDVEWDRPKLGDAFTASLLRSRWGRKRR